MDEYLNANECEYMENIFSRIDSGARRISVAMTVGIEKSIFSILLADEIVKRYSEKMRNSISL